MYFTIYLILINLLSFFLFGVDKRRATQHLWRIPERRLFLTALLGGSIGAQMGMLCFRHKTKHTHFTFGIPLIAIVQILAIIFIINN